MKNVFLLIAFSAFTLGVGLVAPTMKTEPRLSIYGGDYTEVMLLLFPEDFTASSYSIVEGIELMWRSGSQGIAALIFGFSVVFPIAKLLILWLAAIRLRANQCPGQMLKWVEKLGKFSMIDVFVISILIVTIKGLPGGSQIHPEWGLYIFALSVITSIIAGFLLSQKAHTINKRLTLDITEPPRIAPLSLDIN